MKKNANAVKAHSKDRKTNSEVVTAVVGTDLGDKRSAYCVVDMAGSPIGEGVFTTSADAIKAVFGGTGQHANSTRKPY